MLVYLLVSRNRRTGQLDARAFATLELAQAFQDQWAREEPGRYVFRIVRDPVRVALAPSGFRKTAA